MKYGWLWIVVMMGLLGQAVAQGDGKIVPIKKTSFQDVAKHLNPNGDFYLYLNNEEFTAKALDLVDSLEKLATKAAQAEGGDLSQVEAGFHVVRKLLTESGLLEMRALGMSSVQRAPKLHYHNVVLYHGPEPTTGKLWQVAGDKPTRFTGLDLMPETTVVGATGTFRAAILWEWITTIVSNSGDAGRQGLEQMRRQAAKDGVDIDAMMASLSGQATFAVTMDPKTTFPASPKAPDLRIPDTAFLLALSVENDALFDAFSKNFEGNPNVERPQIPGATAVALPTPAQLPMRLKPTLAKTKGLLLIGSNPKIVEEALAVQIGGRGLVHTSEFGEVTEHLPKAGNQLFFVSRRLSETAQSIMQEAIAMADDMEPAEREWVQSMMKSEPFQAGMVTVRQDDAMVMYGNSSASLGKLAMMQATVMPTAIMAGMLMPALGSARDKARRANCANNLKQLGLAMTIYAADKGEKLPHSWRELTEGEYITNGPVWDCPGSKRKTLSATDTDYVYLGAGLELGDGKPAKRIVAHSPPGAFKNWTNFLFLDGHVQGARGSEPQAIARSKGWLYRKH